MASSIKRKNAFFLDFDTTQWLKQFNKTADDFKGSNGAFERAVKRIVPMVEQEFRSFMSSHNLTNTTIDSLMGQPELTWGDSPKFKNVGKTTKGKKGFSGHETKVVGKEHMLFVEYGFQIDKGGLPALFLDIGRPGIRYKSGKVSKEQKPSFFIYYAVERNIGKFNEIFKEEVLKELGGLI